MRFDALITERIDAHCDRRLRVGKVTRPSIAKEHNRKHQRDRRQNEGESFRDLMRPSAEGRDRDEAADEDHGYGNGCGHRKKRGADVGYRFGLDPKPAGLRSGRDIGYHES